MRANTAKRHATVCSKGLVEQSLLKLLLFVQRLQLCGVLFARDAFSVRIENKERFDGIQQRLQASAQQLFRLASSTASSSLTISLVFAI